MAKKPEKGGKTSDAGCSPTDGTRPGTNTDKGNWGPGPGGRGGKNPGVGGTKGRFGGV